MDLNKIDINSDKRVLVYRLIITVLGWTTIIIGQILNILDPAATLQPWYYNLFGSYRYYTMQTNLMVLSWLSLGLIFHNKPNIIQKLIGNLKGAFTLYITVTFLVFAIILSPLYHPVGFYAFSNIVLHYIIPISFILDWIITEKSNYKWKFLLYWIIYPICYLVFDLIYGFATGDYIYPFLDINKLGIPVFLISISILVILYISLGIMYIGINRKWLKIKNK
ncbi:MAG: Pr6Pr family membrane protein [Candidatus Helarchaeota archaeon]